MLQRWIGILFAGTLKSHEKYSRWFILHTVVSGRLSFLRVNSQKELFQMGTNQNFWEYEKLSFNFWNAEVLSYSSQSNEKYGVFALSGRLSGEWNRIKYSENGRNAIHLLICWNATLDFTHGINRKHYVSVSYQITPMNKHVNFRIIPPSDLLRSFVLDSGHFTAEW